MVVYLMKQNLSVSNKPVQQSSLVPTTIITTYGIAEGGCPRGNALGVFFAMKIKHINRQL